MQGDFGACVEGKGEVKGGGTGDVICNASIKGEKMQEKERKTEILTLPITRRFNPNRTIYRIRIHTRRKNKWDTTALGNALPLLPLPTSTTLRCLTMYTVMVRPPTFQKSVPVTSATSGV